MWIVSPAEQVTSEPSAILPRYNSSFPTSPGVSVQAVATVCAAVTKYHMLCGLYKGNLFPHSSGGWKLEIKMGRVISSEASLSLACR